VFITEEQATDVQECLVNIRKAHVAKTPMLVGSTPLPFDKFRTPRLGASNSD